MTDTFSQTYGPQVVGSVFQVASQFIGRTLVASICKQFPGRKTQRGDAYMDGARHLLRVNFHLIDPDDHPAIEKTYEETRNMRAQLRTSNDSKMGRFLKARKYKFLSKELYVVVKQASDRGVDDSLLDQIRRATRGTGREAPGPFDDPPAPPFTDSSVNSLDEVEMTTYQSEITGDVAVGLSLRGQGEVAQDVVTTFSSEVLANDNADHGDLSVTVAPAGESNMFASDAEVDEER